VRGDVEREGNVYVVVAICSTWPTCLSSIVLCTCIVVFDSRVQCVYVVIAHVISGATTDSRAPFPYRTAWFCYGRTG
jgi:hypothetical protein